MLKYNCHTHTDFCDGKNTAEEMVKAAIDKGFVALGFSGHSPMNFPNDWAMTSQGVELYKKEINRLKKSYSDKIDILCGIELDADYSDVKTDDFDFVIASVHQFNCGGRIFSIDLSPEELTACVNENFNGSWNEMAKEYYNLLVKHVLSGNYDIVGHFDLITKFNSESHLFDESDEDYQRIALAAVDTILEARPDMLFEINTGAMYRCGNPTPYPAEFILKRIYEKGGKITVTSDAHNCDSLDFAFDFAVKYAKKCGFLSSYVMTKNGKKEVMF